MAARYKPTSLSEQGLKAHLGDKYQLFVVLYDMWKHNELDNGYKVTVPSIARKFVNPQTGKPISTRTAWSWIRQHEKELAGN